MSSIAHDPPAPQVLRPDHEKYLDVIHCHLRENVWVRRRRVRPRHRPEQERVLRSRAEGRLTSVGTRPARHGNGALAVVAEAELAPTTTAPEQQTAVINSPQTLRCTLFAATSNILIGTLTISLPQHLPASFLPLHESNIKVTLIFKYYTNASSSFPVSIITLTYKDRQCRLSRDVAVIRFDLWVMAAGSNLVCVTFSACVLSPETGTRGLIPRAALVIGRHTPSCPLILEHL